MSRRAGTRESDEPRDGICVYSGTLLIRRVATQIGRRPEMSDEHKDVREWTFLPALA